MGFDGVDLAEARARNIQVTYAPATNREETADFTMGLILDLERHISQMIISTRSGGWDKIAGTSLYGKTIGIVGVGQIGSAVARRAMGFGMDILGYDIVQRNEPTLYGVIYTTLNDLLRRSDVVTIHTPLNDGTLQSHWRSRAAPDEGLGHSHQHGPRGHRPPRCSRQGAAGGKVEGVCHGRFR